MEIRWSDHGHTNPRAPAEVRSTGISSAAHERSRRVRSRRGVQRESVTCGSRRRCLRAPPRVPSPVAGHPDPLDSRADADTWRASKDAHLSPSDWTSKTICRMRRRCLRLPGTSRSSSPEIMMATGRAGLGLVRPDHYLPVYFSSLGCMAARSDSLVRSATSYPPTRTAPSCGLRCFGCLTVDSSRELVTGGTQRLGIDCPDRTVVSAPGHDDIRHHLRLSLREFQRQHRLSRPDPTCASGPKRPRT